MENTTSTETSTTDSTTTGMSWTWTSADVKETSEVDPSGLIKEEASEPTEPINYKGLKKPELIELARSMGLTLKGTQLKGQIIEQIEKFNSLKTWREDASTVEYEVEHLEGYVYPAVDPTFVIENKLVDIFKAVRFLGKEYAHPPHVLMTGPPGCGKTETVAQFAAYCELPLLKINCSLVREARDWFGYKTADSGTITWVKSQFAEAVSNGNVVILLDEITRATPAVLNSLLPLLDHTKQSFIEEVKEVLHVGPNTFFFATANIGAKFVGSYGKLDPALSDRFAIRIPVTYLSAAQEEKLLVERTALPSVEASRLVKVATQIRKENLLGGKLTETLSTRNLLDAATMFNLLGKNSLEYTIASLFSDQGGADSERAQVLQIIQGQFI